MSKEAFMAQINCLDYHRFDGEKKSKIDDTSNLDNLVFFKFGMNKKDFSSPHNLLK